MRAHSLRITPALRSLRAKHLRVGTGCLVHIRTFVHKCRLIMFYTMRLIFTLSIVAAIFAAPALAAPVATAETTNEAAHWQGRPIEQLPVFPNIQKDALEAAPACVQPTQPPPSIPAYPSSYPKLGLVWRAEPLNALFHGLDQYINFPMEGNKSAGSSPLKFRRCD